MCECQTLVTSRAKPEARGEGTQGWGEGMRLAEGEVRGKNGKAERVEGAAGGKTKGAERTKVVTDERMGGDAEEALGGWMRMEIPA